ncbi:uncharacterized protein LOC144639337 isoform X1 [Oculina patagonica]
MGTKKSFILYKKVLHNWLCKTVVYNVQITDFVSQALAAVNILTFAQAIKAVKHELETDTGDGFRIRNNLTDEAIQVSYSGIGFFAADVVMAMILVCGACQLKPCVLWSWVIWRFLMFAHLGGVTTFVFIVWEKVPPVGVILLVDIVLAIGCFIVVFSLIQEIKENEELKNDISMDSPAILISNQQRLSSPEQYF